MYFKKSSCLFLFCCFTSAISLSQETPSDSRLALFITTLDLFLSCLSCCSSTANARQGQNSAHKQDAATVPKTSRNDPKAKCFDMMISCIFSPLIHIHLPDTNGAERKAIDSRNKETKLNSSSLHGRDIQCSQLHRQQVETQETRAHTSRGSLSFC